MKSVRIGPQAEARGFKHLDPLLSVTRKVGYNISRNDGNDPLDVKLIQYFLLKLGTFKSGGSNDDYHVQFQDMLKRHGKPFKVDGVFGKMSTDAVMLYQTYAPESSWGAPGTTGAIMTNYTMKSDLTVHPIPNGNQGFPLSDSGKMYTIAHLNERFRTLHPAMKTFITTDGVAPEDLRNKVQELLPDEPQPIGAQAPGGPPGTASFHVARSRHFPVGR